MNKYNCPECKGEGQVFRSEIVEKTDTNNPISYHMECYFCNGTGYAVDEDSFEEFYGRF